MVKMTKLTLAERILNMLELLSIIGVLTGALVIEFYFQQKPCPLCLLQRAGFILAACGFLLNLRFGLRPSHYSIVLIGALFTSFVALRQIALHIVPGSGAFGEAFLGWHLYTWSFIFSMVIVIITTISLGMDRQYQGPKYVALSWVSQILFIAMFFVVIGCFISAAGLCGLFECVDAPVTTFIS